MRMRGPCRQTAKGHPVRWRWGTREAAKPRRCVSCQLEVSDFVRAGLLLERGGGIADRDDLPKVLGEKTWDRACPLVLVHVTQLVGQQTLRFMPPADEHRVSQREANHAWAQKTRLERRCA